MILISFEDMLPLLSGSDCMGGGRRLGVGATMTGEELSGDDRGDLGGA